MKRRLLLGLGATLGVLAIWVALVALTSAVITSRVPVSLPSMHVQALDGYVFVRGTWVIEGQKHAFPLQTTEIQCDKLLNRCTAATAEVGIGGTLYAELTTHDVVEWGPSRVVFTDDSPVCVSYIYTIDLLTESVNAVREKREKPTDASTACDRVEKQLRLSLKDGFFVSQALQKEATPWFGALVLLPLKIFQ